MHGPIVGGDAWALSSCRTPERKERKDGRKREEHLVPLYYESGSCIEDTLIWRTRAGLKLQARMSAGAVHSSCTLLLSITYFLIGRGDATKGRKGEKGGTKEPLSSRPSTYLLPRTTDGGTDGESIHRRSVRKCIM